LYVPQAGETDLATLAQQLEAHQHDPRLVAVGEIGLDYFVPALTQSPLRELQEHYYRAQLKLARQFDLPVVVHVRRSADRLLKHLRAVAGPAGRWRGIAHAFNGSEVQAREFIQLGFKLGFGGAITFERAHQLRRLAQSLPLDAIVLETDAPDIPPHWLYTTAAEREAGQPQGRNTPAELPRIAEVVAQLRGISPQALAQASTDNACAALPKLAALLV
jgi:TatD DNase family protein